MNSNIHCTHTKRDEQEQ